MKRNIKSRSSRKAWRTRKAMKTAREDFSMKPGQTREDWAREHNIDLEWSDKWGRVPKDYSRVLPNPWLGAFE
jgi:hypothetical protein